MDYKQNPFNCALVATVTGSATYSVQGTADDPASGSAAWFNHPTMVNLTATAQGNWAFAVRGTRLNQTVGAGSVSLLVTQSGQDDLPEPRVIA
jgi:hypothetical protein